MVIKYILFIFCNICVQRDFFFFCFLVGLFYDYSHPETYHVSHINFNIFYDNNCTLLYNKLIKYLFLLKRKTFARQGNHQSHGKFILMLKQYLYGLLSFFSVTHCILFSVFFFVSRPQDWINALQSALASIISNVFYCNMFNIIMALEYNINS